MFLLSFQNLFHEHFSCFCLKLKKHYFLFVCSENKPKPTITQQPDAEKLYVGENVSFECKVENSDGWSYDWYKDEASIPNNSNSLKMKGLVLLNGGVYKCKAKREKTGFNTEFSDQRTVQISGELKKDTLKSCDLRYFGVLLWGESKQKISNDL